MKGDPRPVLVDENPGATARVEYLGYNTASVLFRAPSGTKYRFSVDVWHTVKGEADILYFERLSAFKVTRQ